MTAAVVQAVMMSLVSAAASGRLPRNRWVWWLRTTTTLSSEIAWQSGHAVALRRLR